MVPEVCLLIDLIDGVGRTTWFNFVHITAPDWSLPSAMSKPPRKPWAATNSEEVTEIETPGNDPYLLLMQQMQQIQLQAEEDRRLAEETRRQDQERWMQLLQMKQEQEIKCAQEAAAREARESKERLKREMLEAERARERERRDDQMRRDRQREREEKPNSYQVVRQ